MEGHLFKKKWLLLLARKKNYYLDIVCMFCFKTYMLMHPLYNSIGYLCFKNKKYYTIMFGKVK